MALTSNESSRHYSYFIYATCLDIIRKEHCNYELNVPLSFLYVMLAFGLVNNAVSLLVFYDRKYMKKVLSLLKVLRYYYLCNISVVLMLVFNIASQVIFPTIGQLTATEMLNRVLSLLYQALHKLSVAILSYLAVLRCVHSVAPYWVSFSPQADLINKLFLMIMSSLCTYMHFTSLLFAYDLMDSSEIIMTIVFYVVNIVVVVAANICWLWIERHRTNKLAVDRLSLHIGHKLFNYAFMSCAMFLATTVPATVFLAIPTSAQNAEQINCHSCQERIEFCDYLLFTMYTGCFFDNMLYLVQSENYRRDVVWHFKRMFGLKRAYNSDYQKSPGGPLGIFALPAKLPQRLSSGMRHAHGSTRV